MHMPADQGLLEFDAPVTYFWPEFAQKGKGRVLVRQLLTHTTGLPAPAGWRACTPCSHWTRKWTACACFPSKPSSSQGVSLDTHSTELSRAVYACLNAI